MLQRQVEIQRKTRTPGVEKDQLAAFALDVLGELKLEGTVAIEICGKARMAQLNDDFRGKVGPTDVLAFPDGEADETGACHIGDLAVCAPVVLENCGPAKRPFDAEMKRMVLHGILHLAGFDHEADRGQMTRKERALAKKWGLPE